MNVSRSNKRKCFHNKKDNKQSYQAKPMTGTDDVDDLTLLAKRLQWPNGRW